MMKAQDRQLLDIRISEISSGHIGSRKGSQYRFEAKDSITLAEERDPALFKQPTSEGLRDFYKKACVTDTNLSDYNGFGGLNRRAMK